MDALRIIFFGTPEFAVASLRALLSGPDLVVGVVCQPDKPAGRGRRLVAPPVKELAAERQLSVWQPQKLRDQAWQATLAALQPDLIVVAAYGKILPPDLLTLPASGCINVHASLLPKYRGAAPIQWAILSGEETTGVTIMRMDEGMDTGDILLQRSTQIGADETYGELQHRLAKLGAEVLLEAIELLKRGNLQPQPQDDSQATLAPMIRKERGSIDWPRPASELARAVRAFNPWPSAYTTLNGELLKIHHAHVVDNVADPPGTIHIERDAIAVACGKGALSLDELQLAGRRRLSAREFVRGVRLAPGARLPS